MFKKLATILGMLLVVLAVACGSDKESTSDKVQNDKTPAATKAAATSGDSLKAAFEPLSLLTGQIFGSQSAGSEQAQQQADPDLAALLLAESDLPSGYFDAGGDIGYSMDSPQGQMKMAMRMFVQGDPSMAEMGPTVMSGAIAVPPSVFADFQSSLDKVDQASAQDLQNAMGATEALGIKFTHFSAKRVSDLGEGGVSIHMVMDMSGLLEGFGAAAQEALGDFQSGIAIDMYVFKSGDRLLMVMTMTPTGQASPVDVQSLAEIMESRAQ